LSLLKRAQRNHLTKQSKHRPNRRKSRNLSDRAGRTEACGLLLRR
jgi:hypothetical protein